MSARPADESRYDGPRSSTPCLCALSAALGPLWPPTALWLLCGPCSARGCSPRTLLTQDPCRYHLRSGARGVLMTCLWLLLTTTYLNLNVSQSLLYPTFDVKAILPNSGDKVALDSDVLGVCSCEAIGAPMFSHTLNASANLDADVWTDLDDDVLDSDGLCTPLLHKQPTKTHFYGIPYFVCLENSGKVRNESHVTPPPTPRRHPAFIG